MARAAGGVRPADLDHGRGLDRADHLYRAAGAGVRAARLLGADPAPAAGPASRWYELSWPQPPPRPAALVRPRRGSSPRWADFPGPGPGADVRRRAAAPRLGDTPGRARALAGPMSTDARPAIELVFVWLHVAGVLLFLCALGLALARFFRSDELLVPAFAVAILLNVASYLFILHAPDVLGAREIAAVLPLGAVLAGRLLAGPLLSAVPPAAERGPGCCPPWPWSPRATSVPSPTARRSPPGTAGRPAAGHLAGRARPHRRAGRVLGSQQHHAGQPRPHPCQWGNRGPGRQADVV